MTDHKSPPGHKDHQDASKKPEVGQQQQQQDHARGQEAHAPSGQDHKQHR